MLVVSFFVPTAGADDWPMFRHDSMHLGTSGEILNPPLELKWKFPIGGSVSSPAVSNGTVYIGSGNNNLYAINSNSGTLKWKFETDKGISSSPAVSNGIVYIGSNDHYLYALDAIDGSLKWKYQTSAIISSSPAVSENIVYVSTYNGNIYGLDANNGDLKWEFQTSQKIISSPAVSNGVVYVGSIYGYDGYVYAIDANSGILIWKSGTGHMTASLVVYGNTVYGSDLNGCVYAINRSTGVSKWKYKRESGVFTHPMSSSPAVSDGILYIGSMREYVYALSADTGNLNWKYTSDVSSTSRYRSFHSSPAVSNSIVYIGSDDNFVYAFDAITGTLKWRYQTGGKVISSPSISEGNLYIGSEDGYLYAFTSSNESGVTHVVSNVPELISPINGAIMDNGCTDGRNDRVWDFNWSDVDGTSEYQLYLKDTINPEVNLIVTSSSNYHISSNSYISGNHYDWMWKVRAKVNGQWDEWSETRGFLVEEVNTDLPTLSLESVPTTTPNYTQSTSYDKKTEVVLDDKYDGVSDDDDSTPTTQNNYVYGRVVFYLILLVVGISTTRKVRTNRRGCIRQEAKDAIASFSGGYGWCKSGKLYSDAKSALDSGDFSKAKKLTKQAEKYHQIEKSVSDEIESVRKKVPAGYKSFMEEIDLLLDKGLKMLEEGDLDAAGKLVSEAKAKFAESFETAKYEKEKWGFIKEVEEELGKGVID